MDTNHMKNVVDLLAASVSVGALLKILPAVAALLSIVWTALRVFDWIEARIEKRRLKNTD